MSETLYENFLKGEYAVENGDASLIITKSSCYRVKEETIALVENLPARGDKQHFIKAMEGLGIAKAAPIFDRLLAIGALRLKEKKKLSGALSAIVRPDFRLIPAAWQEKAFRALGLAPSPEWLGRNFGKVFALAAAGLLLSLAVSYTGLYPALAKLSHGAPATLTMFALVFLGSVIHELGHSYAAAAAGIAFRPIGFSIYLFLPVFYANVSGMERLPLKEKAAIDLGGFFTESAYLLLLLALWFFTKDLLFLAAVKWMSLIIVFNMNPLLRTDAYWLYKDFRKSFPGHRLADWFHYLYLAAFLGFSLYLFKYIYLQAGTILALLSSIWASPALLLSEGYKIILGFYLIIIFFTGGAKRLEETRQEWLEMKGGKAPARA
ncbi:MAG TPA: hypothetical protein DEQ38_04750 [Elusimicrobia bacterium]|nr:MAG: hypothetical protein A2089_00715 [Elusimicrobia bacterium GWD2_63_28]HCC47410.1 hypothetical protein [Elusimicrobiota bacterium]